MPEIRPLNGMNTRIAANLVPSNQWISMQNVDMKKNLVFEQIDGSVKFHGATIGNNEPTAIIINYDNDNDKQDILVSVDDKIMKKNQGANEFEELKTGLTPNKIEFSVGLANHSFMAHPDDGLLEYDGASQVTVANDIKLKDIIFAKEVNRAFGILADIPNAVVWSSDVTTTGGVPIEWPGINISTFPTKEGDELEKLAMLNGRLILLATNGIWIQFINGAPTSWRPQEAPTSVGCIAPQTVQKVGQELWFLGFSPETGRGIYAFDGKTSRLLSYDVTNILDSINELKIQGAVAQHVGNIYKISFAVGRSPANDTTLHLDTINSNPDTASPNIYGPHTYGFSASVVLNTKKFKGQHLFAKKYTDGARVFEVRKEYQTQHSSELNDDGDLIQASLLSRIVDIETVGKNILDNTWLKRYENIFSEIIPTGTHSANVELLKGNENETFLQYDQFLEAENISVENIDLDSSPIDFVSSSLLAQLESVLSDAIQLKVTNSSINTKLAYKSLRYDVRPVRRRKVAQNVQL